MLQRVPAGHPDRQRPGIHLPGPHGVVAGTRHRAHPDSAGKPTQNAYIESFNGRVREECLNENWFEPLAQAREIIALWRQDYNEVWLHGSFGRIPPAAFAARHREPSTIDAGSVNRKTLDLSPNDWAGPRGAGQLERPHLDPIKRIARIEQYQVSEVEKARRRPQASGTWIYRIKRCGS